MGQRAYQAARCRYRRTPRPVDALRRAMAAIGILTLELRMEHSHSLKDKRHWVRGVKDRLRNGHNVAVSEVADQELWQSSVVCAVTISPSRQKAAQVLEDAERTAAAFLGPYLVSATIEWMD